MSIYLSKFCLQLCCQGIEVKLPMCRAFHLQVATLPRLKAFKDDKLWFGKNSHELLCYLDENIVSNCRNVCVFANDVRQSPLFYLLQHGPSEWPNNLKGAFLTAEL